MCVELVVVVFFDVGLDLFCDVDGEGCGVGEGDMVVGYYVCYGV